MHYYVHGSIIQHCKALQIIHQQQSGHINSGVFRQGWKWTTGTHINMKGPHKVVVSFAKDWAASAIGIYCLTVLEARSLSRAGSFQELQGGRPLQLCLLVLQMTVFSLCTWPWSRLVCCCVKISLFSKVSSQTGSGPILQNLLSLITSVKTLSVRKFMFWQLGNQTSTCEFWESTIKCIAVIFYNL